MGTLISLPSPVPRQGQKLFKPDYFDHLKEIQKAKDAVEQVHDVLCSQQDIWSTENIRLWLPSILRYKASIGALLHRVVVTSNGNLQIHFNHSLLSMPYSLPSIGLGMHPPPLLQWTKTT